MSRALNKLRRIDADLLTLYEWHRDPDGGAQVESAWPTLKKLGERLAEAVDEMEKELKENAYDRVAAARWNYLFNPRVSFSYRNNEWILHFRVDSKTVRFVGSGSSLEELVDRQLNLKW